MNKRQQNNIKSKNEVKQNKRKQGESKQYPYEFIPNLSCFVDIDEQKRRAEELEQEI